MSWIEKVNSDFTIKTGEGSTFTPNWLNANKAIEYNVSVFEFKELQGSLVKRRTQRGSRYVFEIYFQGDDNLDTSEAFEIAAANVNAWNVSHPIYGSILVQPIGMTFDNSLYNVTKITGEWIETISEDAPKVTLSPKDKILTDKASVDTALESTYLAQVTVKAADVNAMSANNNSFYNRGIKAVTDSTTLDEYFKAFNDANNAISNAIAVPSLAIQRLQAVINKPFSFATSVQNRIALLLAQINNLIAPISGSRKDKKLYENNGGTIIGAMAAASVTDATYSTRKEAVTIVESIMIAYDNYIASLDSISTANGGSPNSYIADAESIILLSNLVDYTVASLLQIATNSRQEISFYLPEDITLIQLAFDLYGLDEEDESIDELIAINDIGLNEAFILPKGRQITYYA